LIGGFVIDEIVRIDRKDDADSVSEKWADYSSGTISKLFEQGRKDTIAKLYDQDKPLGKSSSSIKEASVA
jgi:NTE family protein